MREELRARLLAALAANADQVAGLLREHAAIVAAAADSNTDDEHDPEGATLAFERQQAAALLGQARATGAELRAALARLDAGSYGRCADCGVPIPAERLAARPAARTCLPCAAARGRR